MTNGFDAAVQYTKTNRTRIHLYAVKAVFALAILLRFGEPVGEWAALTGNHTLMWNPIIVLILADASEIAILAPLGPICFLIMIIYPISLITAYALAVFRKKYLPIAVTAWFDILFSIFTVLLYVYIDTLAFSLTPMLIGMILNLGFSISFLRFYRTTVIHKEKRSESL